MKLILTITTAVLLASPAQADKVKSNVRDVYENITQRVPVTENVCSIVDVPIYGRSGTGASAGDVLGGMIIGGLLGKGVTGKDKGAAAGAVLGGVIAADKGQGSQVIVGYEQQQRCETITRYNTESYSQYSHSIITFSYGGRTHRLRFER